jgi:hypothetical protein
MLLLALGADGGHNRAITVRRREMAEMTEQLIQNYFDMVESPSHGAYSLSGHLQPGEGYWSDRYDEVMATLADPDVSTERLAEQLLAGELASPEEYL